MLSIRNLILDGSVPLTRKSCPISENLTKPNQRKKRFKSDSIGACIFLGVLLRCGSFWVIKAPNGELRAHHTLPWRIYPSHRPAGSPGHSGPVSGRLQKWRLPHQGARPVRVGLHHHRMGVLVGGHRRPVAQPASGPHPTPYDLRQRLRPESGPSGPSDTSPAAAPTCTTRWSWSVVATMWRCGTVSSGRSTSFLIQRRPPPAWPIPPRRKFGDVRPTQALSRAGHGARGAPGSGRSP